MPNERGCGSRGRGKGKGKGRGKGQNSNARRSLDLQLEGPSTSNELEKARTARSRDVKNVKNLSADDKKRLTEAKRKKEMSRILLPDAPPKRSRKQSPDRQPCRLAEGTPSTLPAPIRQPWQRVDVSPQRQQRVQVVDGTPSTLPEPDRQPWQRGDISPQRQQSPALSTLFTTPTTSRLLDQAQAPKSGSSIQSYIEVPNLSPSYWRPGIDVDVEIEACSVSESGSPPTTWTTPMFDISRSFGQLSKETALASVHDKEAETNQAITPPLAVATSSNNDTSPVLIVVPNDPQPFRLATLQDNDEEDEDSDPEISEPWDPQPFASREAANLEPATIADNIDPALLHLLDQSDRLNDVAIRQLATPDLLFFDWRSDPEHFSGKRETFTGSVGPTESVKDLHPVEVFLKIWDAEALDIIVRETNIYAQEQIAQSVLKQNSRLKTWTPTDRQEILTFFAFLIFQGVVPLPVERDYFKASGRLAMPGLSNILSYNRFILLKKFLHFNSQPIENIPASERQLHKLGKLPEYLNQKFSSLYTPGQNIAIDESLLHWSGRLTIAQKIANKAAKVGIKTYELCESSTGYLWRFIIYCGKQKSGNDEQQEDLAVQDAPTGDEAATTIEPDGYTAKVVYQLATPLFGKGHTLAMDNFYNSPLLARCLKTKQTDVLGTLRISREFVPESLKSVSKTELRVGEVVYSQTPDLTVFAWRDANLVSLISTFHPVEIGAKEKYGSWRYKPKAVLDYNSLMGGVDKKDQLLSAFPMERIRNQVWYKKLFRRLLNVSILNAQIIHSAHNNKLKQRQFRIVLAEEMLARFRIPNPSTIEVKVLAGKRPILSGNHYMIKGASRHLSCVWCRRSGKLSRTVFKCEQCSVSLCFDTCFKEYHTVRD